MSSQWPPPDALVLAGDAAEDRAAYQADLDELWGWYRPEGVIEEQLVVRLVELRWRLRRVALAERGAIGDRTFGTRFILAEGRTDRARFEVMTREHGGGPLQLGCNPVLIRSALASLRILRYRCDAGGLPSEQQVHRGLQPFFGVKGDGKLMGQGHMIADWFRSVRSVATEERAAGRDPKKKPSKDYTYYRSGAITALEGAIADAEAIWEKAEADTQAADAARVDSLRLPRGDVLKSLSAYERHLEAAIERATQDLERRQARRRLAEVARRAGLVRR